MKNYICPQCDKLMLYDKDMGSCYCNTCQIKYFEHLNNAPHDLLNGKFIVNAAIYAEGTFEYCCRAYKLKVFS